MDDRIAKAILEELQKQTSILEDMSSYISEISPPDNSHSINRIYEKLEEISNTLGYIETNTSQ